MGRDRFAEALADAREQIGALRSALDAAGAARAQNLQNCAVDAEKDAAPSSPRKLTFGTFSADPSQTPPLPSPTPSPPPPDTAPPPPAAAPAPRRQIKFDAALVPPPAVAYAPPPRPLPLRPAPAPRVARSCLTLQQPYASLLMRGEKTLETRMTDFLKAHEGTELLIHVGKNPGGRWALEGLKLAGGSAAALAEMSRLPPGMQKGMIVGVVRVGRTRAAAELADVAGWEAVEAAARVPRALLGKAYVTEIKSPRWLRRGVAATPTEGGVWTATLRAESI